MTPDGASAENMRWRDYVLLRGADFDNFWCEHGNEPNRKLLLIVGRGFDPRTAIGIEKLVASATNCPVDVMGLEFDDGESMTSGALNNVAAENWERVQSAITGRGQASLHPIRFRSDDGHRVAARNAANVIPSESVVASYTDVIVDVSAMPRGIFFPLIARLLYFHDRMRQTGTITPNLHIVVSEDPALDTSIREQGIDETASFLHPFEGEFNREAKGVTPAVWIPVLGEALCANMSETTLSFSK